MRLLYLYGIYRHNIVTLHAQLSQLKVSMVKQHVTITARQVLL